MKFSVFLLIFQWGLLSQAESLFTPQEITLHQQNIETITSTASTCLKRVYAEHTQFFKLNQVSKYYGDRNPTLATRQQREAQLIAYGKSPRLEPQLEPISCIGLTVKCLGEGFEAAGQKTTWDKIMSKLRIENKMLGTDLQVLLQQLGWKVLYWNPNPSQNAEWDREDQTLNPLKPGKSWNPVWGGHAYHYTTVLRQNIYYGIKVDDKSTLVGFNTTLPESFKAQPFFVGVAHAGYHVFPGSFGNIIEAHSMRKLNSFENLEVSPFNPLSASGGPRWTRSEKYRSGVIAVPPAKP
jgi:hypothetical protein